jgi:mRNA interferase MazF
VLSVPALDQDRALVTVIPHRFEVNVGVGFLRPGVFDAQNVVTIPMAKLMRKLGVISREQLSAVENAVRLWLNL